MLEWRCSDRHSSYYEGARSGWVNYPPSVIEYYSPPQLTSPIIIQLWNVLYQYETEWIKTSEMTGVKGFSILQAQALLIACGTEWYPDIHAPLVNIYGTKLTVFLTKK